MSEDCIESLRKIHHERDRLCTTRPKYRDGRQLKAVKVYTISDESKYLLVRGISVVPGSYEGLVEKLRSFGNVTEEKILSEYPLESSEKFTKVALVKFARIASARIAKRKLDNLNYLGELLHICYAPEFESVDETGEKLEQRAREVKRRVEQLKRERNSEIGSQNTSLNGIQPNSAAEAVTVDIRGSHSNVKVDINEANNSYNNATYQNHSLNPPYFQMEMCQPLATVHRPITLFPSLQNHLPPPLSLSWHLPRSNYYHSPPNLTTGEAGSVNNTKSFLGGTTAPRSKFIPRQVQNVRTQMDASVNAELKKNALALRNSVQGPQLPEDVERKRKTFMNSKTGDPSLDLTRAVISKKLKLADS